MKEYPYILIIFLEFWREQKYIEDDILIITGVTECDDVGVYGVRFIKESWSGEAMLDLPPKIRNIKNNSLYLSL